MRYERLLQPKFFEAFKHYDEKNSEILKEFEKELSNYHYLMMLAQYDYEGRLRDNHPEKSDLARQMWPEGASVEECILSLKRKSSGGWVYKVDPTKVNSDEIMFLLLYPFCHRVADAWEGDFASSGELYKWLCLLKEKVETEESQNRRKTCCFTGHRPHLFPWGEDTNNPKAKALLATLDTAIEEAVSDGFTEFICGGALGVDTWAATRVLKAKEKYPQIRLTIAHPWKEHNKNVTDPDYLWVNDLADSHLVVSKEEGKIAFTARDRWMVDHSRRIIAVYDDRSGLKGGTWYTLQYAMRQDIEIKQILWMDF